MTVTDSTAFRRHLAIVYNTDTAASGQIADYVCLQYGIPGANKIGFAMGAGWQWAYTTQRYQDVFVTLNTHLATIGATGVLLCEGSPNRMLLPIERAPSNVTSNGHDTARMLALTRRIVAANASVAYGEPRLFSTAADTGNTPRYQQPRTDAWVSNEFNKLAIYGDMEKRGYVTGVVDAANDVREYSSYITAGTDPVMEAARGSFTGVDATCRIGTQFVPGFDYDFSRFKMLPYGRIGLPHLAQSDTFDASLYTKSKAIIDRGVLFEKTMAGAKANMRILFPFSYCGGKTSEYNLGRQALAYKKALDAGFTQLKYWYRNTGDETTWDQTALAMAPAAGGLQATSNWTAANLSAGTATSQTFDMFVGGGLENGSSGAVTGDVATAWCSTSAGMTPASTGAIVMGGASYLYQWVDRLLTLDRFVAAFCNPWCNGGSLHHGAGDCDSTTDIFNALLTGRSLMEAAALCHEGTHYAMGNPLVRPFAQ